jgi:DNA mismatch endonuclease (patch repair protein)
VRLTTLGILRGTIELEWRLPPEGLVTNRCWPLYAPTEQDAPLRAPSRSKEGNRALVDTVSPARRSEIMRLVRSKNTKPELQVRRLVHSMGYRYRLHSKILPGHPDLVFAGLHRVIFVHGCFWHRHAGCAQARLPKSRTDFWIPKLEANRKRDSASKRRLVQNGWRVLTIWECQVKNADKLRGRIGRFLDA